MDELFNCIPRAAKRLRVIIQQDVYKHGAELINADELLSYRINVHRAIETWGGFSRPASHHLIRYERDRFTPPEKELIHFLCEAYIHCLSVILLKGTRRGGTYLLTEEELQPIVATKRECFEANATATLVGEERDEAIRQSFIELSYTPGEPSLCELIYVIQLIGIPEDEFVRRLRMRLITWLPKGE